MVSVLKLIVLTTYICSTPHSSLRSTCAHCCTCMPCCWSINASEKSTNQYLWGRSLAISTIPAAGGPPWASSAHAWNAWHVLVLFVLSSCSTCMHAYVYDVWVLTMSSCHHACISWSLLPSSDHLSARFVRLHFVIDLFRRRTCAAAISIVRVHHQSPVN